MEVLDTENVANVENVLYFTFLWIGNHQYIFAIIVIIFINGFFMLYLGITLQYVQNFQHNVYCTEINK